MLLLQRFQFQSRFFLFCHMLQALLGLGSPAASAHFNGTAKHRMMLLHSSHLIVLRLLDLLGVADIFSN